MITTSVWQYQPRPKVEPKTLTPKQKAIFYCLRPFGAVIRVYKGYDNVEDFKHVAEAEAEVRRGAEDFNDAWGISVVLEWGW